MDPGRSVSDRSFRRPPRAPAAMGGGRIGRCLWPGGALLATTMARFEASLPRCREGKSEPDPDFKTGR